MTRICTNRTNRNHSANGDCLNPDSQDEGIDRDYACLNMIMHNFTGWAGFYIVRTAGSRRRKDSADMNPADSAENPGNPGIFVHLRFWQYERSSLWKH